MEPNIQEQLKQPPSYFATCMGQDGNGQCKDCLRRMAWDANERPAIVVLKPDFCSFYPCQTRVQKYGVPDFRKNMTYQEYKAYISTMFGYMSKTTYYKIVKGKYPSDDQVRWFETVWNKLYGKPFPWLRQIKLIVWANDYGLFSKGT